MTYVCYTHIHTVKTHTGPDTSTHRDTNAPGRGTHTHARTHNEMINSTELPGWLINNFSLILNAKL